MALILLVDDEEDIRLTLSIFLTKDGHAVMTASDGDDALRLLKEKPFDILVTDIFLPRMNGMELMAKARIHSPAIQIIVMTGEPTFETAAQAVREGAFDYLSKPVTGEAIRRVVLGAARIKGLNDDNIRLAKENERHREELQKTVVARTEELKQSDERLRLLVTGLHAVVWERDQRNNIFTYVGGQAEELLGYPLSQWYQDEFWREKIYPEDKAKALAFFFGGLAQSSDVEFRMTAANGRCVWVANYITPATGKVAASRGVLVDVSRRKRAEEELRINEERYRTVSELASDFIYEMDVGTDDIRKVNWVTGAFSTITGYDLATGLDIESWRKVVHPDDAKYLLAGEKKIASGSNDAREFRIVTQQGKVRWLRRIARPITDHEGKVVRIIGAANDITDEKLAEQSQRALEEKLRKAQEKQETHLLSNLDFGGSTPRIVVGEPAKSGQHPFFGAAPAMQKILELSGLASEHDETVLIDGETGTGKGVLAKWIHDASRRSAKPFVAVNCSSLRGDLLASELFGHAKGAFTSAMQDRKGLVEEAGGGTLFLDEMGEMDAVVQAQFLKVLEEKSFRRLGEVKVRSSDFRLVCATNRDLWGDVTSGRFRRDLFFRLNVFPIHIPPLRERVEDLPGLLKHILKGLDSASVWLPEQTLDFLAAYSWPGNVRELRNLLIRAVLLARQGPILPEHFPGLRDMQAPATRAVPAVVPSDPAAFNSEEDEIQTLLRRFRGNRIKTAEAMGISRSTLYRKLRKMGIEP